jgi:allophanate hydrolase subunit 1
VFKRSLPEDDDFLDDEPAILGDFDKLAIDVADFAEMEGRDGSDSCEIHINSDYIVGAIGLLAAGLAYITYVAITQGRRRKKRWSTEGTDSIGDSALTAVLLGMALVRYG